MAGFGGNRTRAQVPDQHFGHGLQTSRCLVRLLDASAGDEICVEVLDDVSVTKADGSHIVEQTKASRVGNPIADRSVDLWKTLANWVDAVRAAKVTPERARFEIFVSRKRPGGIANTFHNADNDSEALAAVEAAAAQILKGRKQTSAKANAKRAFADRTILARVVARLKLVFGSGRSTMDLRAAVAARFVSPELVDDVLQHALGWVKVRLDECLEAGHAAVLTRDAFLREMTAFVRRRDRRTVLTSSSRPPTPDEVSSQVVRRRTYLRQLELVGCDENEQVRAANDFLMASADRAAWAEQGAVTEASYQDFESSLLRAWDNKRHILEVTSKHLGDSDRGMVLYRECLSYKEKLEGLEPPAHFVSGSYHVMADVPKLGWHVDYVALLASLRGPHK